MVIKIWLQNEHCIQNIVHTIFEPKCANLSAKYKLHHIIKNADTINIIFIDITVPRYGFFIIQSFTTNDWIIQNTNVNPPTIKWKPNII